MDWPPQYSFGPWPPPFDPRFLLDEAAYDRISLDMTIALKKIVGELSGLSAEKQQVAASVIHALWNEEHTSDTIHPEWEAELDRRNAQIQNDEIQLVSESAMDVFVSDLLKDDV